MRTVTIMMFVVFGIAVLGCLSHGAWLFCQCKIKSLLRDPKSSNDDVRKWISRNKVARISGLFFVFPPVSMILFFIYFLSAIIEGLRELWSELTENICEVAKLYKDEWKGLFGKTDEVSDEKIRITRERIASGKDI